MLRRMTSTPAEMSCRSFSADSVAGEANLGTLRYLLSVPVDRTRLLVVKLGAITVFAFAATMVVAGVGALLGLAVFGAGPMVSLSGSQLPFWDGVLRLVLARFGSADGKR